MSHKFLSFLSFRVHFFIILPYFQELPPRLNFNELEKFYLDYVDDGFIGLDTPKNLAISMTNFLECLIDTEHKLPEKDYKIFRLIEDYGIRNLTVGNPGKGKLPGAYRSFLVEYNGDTKFISFLVIPYSRNKNPHEFTAIIVAVDGDNDLHASLEMTVDDQTEIIGNKINFYHHGRTTKGRRPLKVDGLRELVAEKYPEIIYGKKFYLGTLTNNRLFYLDDPEVMQVIENLISYALIRDDYRAMF